MSKHTADQAPPKFMGWYLCYSTKDSDTRWRVLWWNCKRWRSVATVHHWQTLPRVPTPAQVDRPASAVWEASCAVCGNAWVDVLAGEDTCPDCVRATA